MLVLLHVQLCKANSEFVQLIPRLMLLRNKLRTQSKNLLGKMEIGSRKEEGRIYA